MTEKLLVAASALSVLLSQAPSAFGAQSGPERGIEAGMHRVVDGVASFYADKFHGKRTASGEFFNMHALTCAHRYLPFGTKLLVKNANNGKTVTVTVNDRGPFCGSRVLDLSLGAAQRLGISGVGHVICYTTNSNNVGSKSVSANAIAMQPAAKPAVKHSVPANAIAMRPAAKPAVKHAVPANAIAMRPAAKPLVKHSVPANAIAMRPAAKPTVKHSVPANAIAMRPAAKPTVKHAVPANAIAMRPAAKPAVKHAVPANAIAMRPAAKPLVKHSVPANAIAMRLPEPARVNSNKSEIKPMERSNANLVAMLPPPPMASYRPAITPIQTQIATASLRPQLMGSVAQSTLAAPVNPPTSSTVSTYLSRQSRIEIRRQRTTTVAMDTSTGVVTVTSIETSSN